MRKFLNNYLEKHTKDQFYYLLAAMALFLLVPPFTSMLGFSSLIIYITVSFVIISCATILYHGSEKINIGSGILFICLAFTWFTLSPTLDKVLAIQIIKPILLLVLFSATAISVIKTILKFKKVDTQVIAGSIGAYLLFGLSGAMLFDLIEVIYPTSFDNSFDYGGGYDMVYFSFVTLSTLGYGDITPHTPQAQAAAILVSIVGQLYLAILMAMLVGKFLKDSDW